MKVDLPASPHLLQPFTLGGVAGFARAPFGKLFRAQLLVALLVIASLGWVLVSGWIPAFEIVVARLPESARIREGRLDWPAPEPTCLVDGKFLSVTVDLKGKSSLGRSADLQVELGERDWKLRSLLGHLLLVYPQDATVALSRDEVRAWWAAWETPVLAVAGLAGLAGLFAAWFLLATLYGFTVGAIAFYSERAVTWLGCWRLAAAALLPGSLVVAAAFILYSLRRIGPVELAAAWLVHLLVGWFYVALAPLRLPRRTLAATDSANPFAGGDAKK